MSHTDINSDPVNVDTKEHSVIPQQMNVNIITIDKDDDKYKDKELVNRFNALPTKYRIFPLVIRDLELRLIGQATSHSPRSTFIESLHVDLENPRGYKVSHIRVCYYPLPSLPREKFRIIANDIDVQAEQILQAWAFFCQEWDQKGYHKKCGQVYDGEYCLPCAVRDLFSSERLNQHCSICQSDTKDYYTLLCGHGYCRECIVKWSTKKIHVHNAEKSFILVKDGLRRNGNVVHMDIITQMKKGMTMNSIPQMRNKLFGDNDTDGLR